MALVDAGLMAFIDKFIRGIKNENFASIAKEHLNKENLSISDVLNKVAEPLTSVLHQEYVRERSVAESTLDLIIAGYEDERTIEAFTLYEVGLSEPVNDFSAIGSGAAYAELFLRYLLPQERTLENVIKSVCYTIRLVGTMDPFVGGKINLMSATEGDIQDISNRASEFELEDTKARQVLQSSIGRLSELLEM